MSRKNERLLIVIYVVAFLITLIGASLAYFTNIKTSMVSSDIEVESATMTSIVFNAGKPLALFVSHENLGEGMGNLKDQTFAEAVLKNGSNETISTFYYNLNLELLDNTLLHTQGSSVPEALVVMRDPFGQVITHIEGLEYVTINGVSGFDITGKIGTYRIAKEYQISTSTQITQRWELELVFVNLNASQDTNKGKGLNGFLKIEPVYDKD